MMSPFFPCFTVRNLRQKALGRSKGLTFGAWKSHAGSHGKAMENPEVIMIQYEPELEMGYPLVI